MFQRILVPLDGSSRAERALSVAARIARITNGSIVLVQVATIPITYPSYLGSSSATEMIESELVEAQIYLKEVAQSEMLHGIDTEIQVLSGITAPEVLAAASAYTADLIVMTSHGYTGTERWVLGSVSQKVARHSPVPVLILHEAGSTPAPHPDASPLHVLVPLDGSELAEAALEPAIQLIAALAAPAQGVLHLLRVVKPPVFDEKRDSQEAIDHMQHQVEQEANDYLDALASQLREGLLANLNLSLTGSVVLADDPAHAIIRVAEHGESSPEGEVFGRSDLVAMATHGRSGWQHWILGSVTERVLGATKLPLLIVRPGETDFQRSLNGGERAETEM